MELKSKLCYSQNVFPADGGTVERIAEIAGRLNELRSALDFPEGEPFPLGLWLDAASAAELADPERMRALRGILEDNGNVVFTVNAFPYGGFHSVTVKEKVYQPDWSSPDRLEYTLRVADILAALLPEGMTGSISTLPGGYGYSAEATLQTEARLPAQGYPPAPRSAINSEWLEAVALNLRRAAERLSAIFAETGRKIILAVEMEPDCVWESPAEFIEFRERHLRDAASERFVGVCYDTCHQELLGVAPGSGLRLLLDAGVPVPKIQLSAALARDIRGLNHLDAVFAGLAKFADGVYLHQTRIFDDKRRVMARLLDIPTATTFSEIPSVGNGHAASIPSKLVSHFHVPIHLGDLFDGFMAAKEELSALAEILSTAGAADIPHLEVETYTYDVLPRELRGDSLINSMRKEYEWVWEHFAK